MNIAVVGLGKMGLLHTSLLKVIPEVGSITLCDSSSLMVRLFKKVFKDKDVAVVDDLNKLATSLDAVYVTTPIPSHFTIIKSLYSKNITRNIFVEKTLSTTHAEAQELSQIAKQLNSITMVGYMKRFNVVFNKAKELMAQGELGEPTSFSAYAYSSDFLGDKSQDSCNSRGGTLRDLGCHIIDLSFWMFGDLHLGSAKPDCSSEKTNEGSIQFTAELSSGLTGQFDISQKKSGYRMPEFGLTIECAKGVIQVNDDRLILTQANASPKKWFRHNLNDNVLFSMGEAEYFREDRQFIDSLLNQKPGQPDFESAAKIDDFIEEVQGGS